MESTFKKIHVSDFKILLKLVWKILVTIFKKMRVMF